MDDGVLTKGKSQWHLSCPYLERKQMNSAWPGQRLKDLWGLQVGMSERLPAQGRLSCKLDYGQLQLLEVRSCEQMTSPRKGCRVRRRPGNAPWRSAVSCLWKAQGGRRENGREIAREVGGELGEVGQ